MDKKTGLITAALALAGACGATQTVAQAPAEPTPIAEHQTEMEGGFAVYCIAEQQPQYTTMHIFSQASFADNNGIDTIEFRAYPGEQQVLDYITQGLGYPRAGRYATKFNVFVPGQVDSLAMRVRDKNGNNVEFPVTRIDCRTLAEMVLINQLGRASHRMNIMRELQQYDIRLPNWM